MKRVKTDFLRSGFLPFVVAGLFALVATPARAAGLDQKESDELRQARQLYKSGNYQEAADIFSRLSSNHPDMPTFGRNAGAAYYYLKKPDPALSNLREYLRVQKKIDAQDREEVDKWIAEMEKLRAQASAPAPADPGGAKLPAGPVPAGQPGGPGGAGQPVGGGQPGAPGQAGTPGYPPPYYPYPVPPGQPQPYPGYPPAYPYPPSGAPTAAPDATGTSMPPAGQPYPPAYPNGYSQNQGASPGAAVPPVQAGVVEATPKPAKSSRVLPWIIGGVGVAALGLGGVFTYLYQSAYSDTRAQYDPARENAGRTYSYLQFVGYGLGAAGVTTAAILLLKSDQGGGTTVSVVPALGPQLAGAEIAVRY